jgi:nucleotide-binding universal stress UspA family protein
MFKHLLLPTDGSPASEKAVLEGLRLARAFRARVTGVHVVPEFHILTYRIDMLEDTRDEFLADCRRQAEKFLAFIDKSAREEGVLCDTLTRVSDHPYEAIVDLAQHQGCDLIVMAPHGQHSAKSRLLGSETNKVLTHSTLPVLVYR